MEPIPYDFGLHYSSLSSSRFRSNNLKKIDQSLPVTQRRIQLSGDQSLLGHGLTKVIEESRNIRVLHLRSAKCDVMAIFLANPSLKQPHNSDQVTRLAANISVVLARNDNHPCFFSK